MSDRHRPSELAAVAARSAVAGATTVRFDVTHLLPGVLPGVSPSSDTMPLGPPAALRPGERIREVLAFEAAGLGLRVRTWTPQQPEEVPAGVAVTDVRPVFAPVRGDVAADLADAGPGRPGGHEYSGHSAVNPSFLYDRTRATEILLTISHGRWRPDLGDCRMVGLALEALTAAAGQAGAPILLLQSPVAPYRDASPSFRKDGAGEEPRPARAMAIRMTVGLDEDRPDRRLAMIRRVAEFAQRNGMGLQLSDSRLGRAAGEWWSVLPVRPADYRRAKGEFADAGGGRAPAEVRVVTFVGPARIGSAAAIFADLAGRKVGVLSVTTTALQEISFVHVVLPVAPARAGRGRRASATVRHDLVQGLGHLASECGLAPRRGRRPAARDVDLSTAAGYCVLESGPVLLPRAAQPDPAPAAAPEEQEEPLHAETVPARAGNVPPDAPTAPARSGPATEPIDDDATAHPLWVSWDLPGEPGARRPGPEPVAVVLDQVEKVPEVASAAVDYARVRRLPDGRSRGKAKLSVVLADQHEAEAVPSVLGMICTAAQTASVAQCRLAGLDVGDVDLRVVWRERWLGAR